MAECKRARCQAPTNCKEPLMRLLALTDSQMDAVLRAAAPLDVDQRGAFLEAIAAELRQHAEIGDGTIDSAIRQTQGRFFKPPDLSRSRDTWRWS
jgi:hypothetical protein